MCASGLDVRRHPPKPLLGAAISNNINMSPLGRVNGVSKAKAVAAGESLLHVSATRCYWSIWLTTSEVCSGAETGKNEFDFGLDEFKIPC